MKNVIIFLSLVFLLSACSQEEFILPSLDSTKLIDTQQWKEASTSPVQAIFGEQKTNGGNQPQTQLFQFQNHEGANIETIEGIIFRIPPYAFVEAKSGFPIDEIVTLQVIEIFEKGDMIMQNKPTNYQQSFLISAGEFFLGASHRDMKLVLDREIEIEVELPVKKDNGQYQNKMKLFSGDYQTGPDGEPTDRFEWNQVIRDTIKMRNSLPAAYVFSISNLGWTNCDAFLNDPRPKTDITVELAGKVPPQDCMLFIVPKNLNGVMRIYRDMRGNFKSMASIPEGLEATIVAVAHSGGQSYVATKDITVNQNAIHQLTLATASSQEVKDKLAVMR